MGRKILEDFAPTLEPSVQKRFLPLLNELKKEPDDAFLLHGLLQVGVRLKSEQQEGPAQALLTRLAQADIPEAIRQQAEREYGGMAGFGAFGMRAEYLGSRLAKDSANWRMIAPMIGATVLGKMAGTAVLGRLAASPARGFLTQSLRARLTAGTAAFLAEFPAFAGLNRALSPVPHGPFTDDLARSALTLGSLRFFNVGARFIAPAGAIHGAPKVFLSQVPAFFGLLAANKLEQHFKLRPIVDGATTLTDTFSSLLALGIGNRLGYQALGRGFARFQAELGIRTQRSPQNDAGTRFMDPTAPLSAETATVGPMHRGLARPSLHETLSKPVWNMSEKGPGESGGKNAGAGEGPVSTERTTASSPSENPGAVSAIRGLLESLQKYLLYPKLIWRGIRAPRDQTKAWERYWSSVQNTGRQGEVHWDSESEVEFAQSLERLRAHVDFSLPMLDLGCGNGRHSRVLAAHFPKVLGVDISSQAIEKAQQETPDAANLSYRVFDLTVPGNGRRLAEEIGETNVYIRGVLHILDSRSRSAMVDGIRDLLGEKGTLYLQETNYRGSLLNYLGFMGATLTYVPTPLRRAIESGIRPPDHFGDKQLREYFPEDKWETLASGKTDLHAVPLRSPSHLHLVPGFFALVRRRK